MQTHHGWKRWQRQAKQKYIFKYLYIILKPLFIKAYIFNSTIVL